MEEQNNKPESAKDISLKHLENINNMLQSLKEQIYSIRCGFTNFQDMFYFNNIQLSNARERIFPLMFITIKTILNDVRPVIDSGFYESKMNLVLKREEDFFMNYESYFRRLRHGDDLSKISYPQSRFYETLNEVESLRGELIMELKEILFALSRKKEETKRV